MATNSVTLISSGFTMQEERAMATSSWAHQKGPGRDQAVPRVIPSLTASAGLQLTCGKDPCSHDGLGEGHVELHSKVTPGRDARDRDGIFIHQVAGCRWGEPVLH